jgi:putative two-component system response regulator
MTDLKSMHILIVDDQPSNVLLMTRLLERDGYTQIASTTRSTEVTDIFRKSPPDLLLLDLHMSDPDGFALMDLLKPWTTSETYVPVLVLTADASNETRLAALTSGARDFLTKPLDAIEVSLRITNLLATRQLQLELQCHNEALEGQVAFRTRELDRARVEAFEKLALASEYRDDETRLHTQRVGRLAAAMAARLGFDQAMVTTFGQVAPLHDLGKIGIPDSILLKPGKLTPEERMTMMRHAQIGSDILAGSSSLMFQIAADIALTHHERWDGTGYPRGLAGNAIPLPGRIVSLADAFDAMSHDRPYRAAMVLPDVLEEIDNSSGTHFDPAVVQAFHELDPFTLLEGPAILTKQLSKPAVQANMGHSAVPA